MLKSKNKSSLICLIILVILMPVLLACLSSCTSENDENTDTGELNFNLWYTDNWEGYYVGTDLYKDLINAENEKIFIVQLLPVDDIAKDFIYKGKSCDEYKQEYKESQALVEKLESLLEEGESLKYGELLCTTGTPEGELWSLERYNYKTQSYYGKNMLESYIVNGEFLKDKVQRDLSLAGSEAKSRSGLLNVAEATGRNDQLDKALSIFKAIDENAVIENGVIELTITKNSLLEIPREQRNQYVIRYPRLMVEDFYSVEWNGLKLDYDLYVALNNAKDTDVFYIYAFYDKETPDNFIYQDKIYSEYKSEKEKYSVLLDKLSALEKDGEYLKYGEAIYNEGLPNGEKWSKEYYDSKVAYYGEKMLGTYIVDGVLLVSDIRIDMVDVGTKIRELENILAEARELYRFKVAEEELQKFKSISQDATIKQGNIYFTITKKAFSNFSIENKDSYLFNIAF